MEGDIFKIEPGYRSELLVRFGFINPKVKNEKYYLDPKSEEWKAVEGEKLSPKDADEENMEMSFRSVYANTGFPKSAKTYRLSWEVPDMSLEEPYFWFLEALRESFVTVEKLEDSFSAAENSAFFGVTQQRLGAQQEKVSQYLATIGKMIKELFQMVRELRIIDERLHYYEGVAKQLSKPLEEREKPDDITLKGLFVDLVQQGAKSAASVFGMARELEFITLPDLFFDAPPFKDETEISNHLKSLEKDFNGNVIRVLARHLNQYMTWRDRTFQEHKQRKRFMLSYLQQHFDIVKMYINWLKPYLRHVARLTMKEQNTASADIISSFEGSMLDLEVLFSKPSKADEKVHCCVLMTYHFRTRPELKIVQEGYTRGPVHTGKMEVQIRTYGWTDDEIKYYKKLKDAETLLLLSQISSSVQEAMVSLGDELTHYINEAKGIREEEKKEEAAVEGKKSFAEKFLGDFYTPAKNKPKSAKKEKKSASGESLDDLKKKAEGEAKAVAWTGYNNFKKAHRMLAW